MDALDPQLRGQQQKSAEVYPDPYRYPAIHNSQSPYTLNPIRSVPPSQHSSLPSISQDPNLPYYGNKSDYPPEEAQDNADASPGGKGDGQEQQKRPRSCESCRALKVRCERDPSATGPCKRCAKADRQCIFTEPSHKRKKKQDSKVAELEKKIDALTASLIAVRGTNATLDNEASGLEMNSYPAQDMVIADEKPSKKRRRSTFERDQDLASANQLGSNAKHSMLSGLSHGVSAPIPPLENAFQNHEYADVIDRQVLSSAVATEIFQFYREKMVPYLPAVVIPSHCTAGDIRQTKPVLFLAILSVASGHKYWNIQRTLTREIMSTYADRIVNKGEKSLELIQALQVSVIWHVAVDQHDTRAFQLIQMAAAMATAIKYTRENGCALLEIGLRQKRNPQSQELEIEKKEVEKKRAWLSCYVLSGISSTSLKQQNAVHWSRFMDDAVKTLENAEEAAPTDRILCQWAKLQRIVDQAIALFFNDGTAKQIFDNLVELEHRAQKYTVEVEATGSCSLKIMHKVVLVYFIYLRVTITALEESAGSSAALTSESKHAFVWKYGEPMSESSMKAGVASVQTMHEAMETFLSTNRDDLDALPAVFFSRITYLVVFLIFLHLRAVAADKKSGSPVNIESLRIGDYLNRFMEQFSGSREDDFSPAVQKFHMVLKMFKSWFERQKDGPRQPLKRDGPSTSQLQAEPIDSERNTPRLGYRKLSVHSEGNADSTSKPATRSPATHSAPEPGNSTASVAQMGNTPLDLLSQVASNEPSATTATDQQAQQQAHQAQQDQWYNQLNPYANTNQVPYVSDTQGYYPQQQDFASVNGYPPIDGNIVMDPELEQAMATAFGSEGNMMGTFFNDFFGIGHSQQNGLPFGTGWYSGTEQ